MMRYVVLIIGFLLVLVGHAWGLFWAPAESYMQNVGRIFYVHVPTAWLTMVTYLFAFIFAIASLWTGKKKVGMLIWKVQSRLGLSLIFF